MAFSARYVRTRSERNLEKLTDVQSAEYEYLLSHPDPDLYVWLMGYEKPTDVKCVNIVDFIRLHDHA